jgi:adhesin transport system outer membrane protein
MLAEENVKAHKDILDSLQERERGGAGSVADVKQTQGRLSMALASLAKTHADLQTALSDYQRLTGVFPGKIALNPYPVEALPKTSDEMVIQAASGNPKLNAAAEDINSESERVKIAQANHHPYVYAELSSSYQDGVEDQNKWEWGNAAMLRLNWNLFSGGSDVAAVRAARSRMRQAQFDREDLLLTIEDKTRSTWAAYQSAMREVEEYTSAVEFNRNTRSIYLEQFGVAQRSLLDVLDSENEVFQSSSQLVTSTVNEQIAAYKLMALSGSLISTLQIDPELYQSKPGEVDE